MTIIILRKNPEYLGTDIFSQQMGGRKQHDGLMANSFRIYL